MGYKALQENEKDWEPILKFFKFTFLSRTGDKGLQCVIRVYNGLQGVTRKWKGWGANFKVVKNLLFFLEHGIKGYMVL